MSITLESLRLRRHYDQVCLMHIPKTAGTWMGIACMKKPCYKALGHMFCFDGVEKIPADPTEANTPDGRFVHANYLDQDGFLSPTTLRLSVVRNPFDLLCSYYFHHDKSIGHDGWSNCNKIHELHSFEDFIEAYCSPTFTWHFPAIKKFLFSQLFTEDGKCACDVIIKYRYMIPGLQELNAYCKTEFDYGEPAIRPTAKKVKPYYEYYNDKMIEMVSKKCERELRAFGYNFAGPMNDDMFVDPHKIRYKYSTDEMEIL